MTVWERTKALLAAPFIGALFCLFLPLVGFILLGRTLVAKRKKCR